MKKVIMLGDKNNNSIARYKMRRFTCPFSNESHICKIMEDFCPSVDISICVKLQKAYNEGFRDCHNLINNKKLPNNLRRGK